MIENLYCKNNVYDKNYEILIIEKLKFNISNIRVPS